MGHLGLDELQALSERWEADAALISRYDATSPVAECVRRLALELRATLATLAAGETLLTIREYAAHHGVTPQTVRNWIRAGTLTKIGTGRRCLRQASSTRA